MVRIIYFRGINLIVNCTMEIPHSKLYYDMWAYTTPTGDILRLRDITASDHFPEEQHVAHRHSFTTL